jgi:hypothetical protein
MSISYAIVIDVGSIGRDSGLRGELRRCARVKADRLLVLHTMWLAAAAARSASTFGAGVLQALAVVRRKAR